MKKNILVITTTLCLALTQPVKAINPAELSQSTLYEMEKVKVYSDTNLSEYINNHKYWPYLEMSDISDLCAIKPTSADSEESDSDEPDFRVLDTLNQKLKANVERDDQEWKETLGAHRNFNRTGEFVRLLDDGSFLHFTIKRDSETNNLIRTLVNDSETSIFCAKNGNMIEAFMWSVDTPAFQTARADRRDFKLVHIETDDLLDEGEISRYGLDKHVKNLLQETRRYYNGRLLSLPVSDEGEEIQRDLKRELMSFERVLLDQKMQYIQQQQGVKKSQASYARY